MPLNDIVADIASRPDAPSVTSAEDDNVPEAGSEATTMRTPPMLPPFVHNQTISDRSAFALVATVVSIIGLLKTVI